MPLDLIAVSRQVQDLREALIAALDRRSANLGRARAKFGASRTEWVGPRVETALANDAVRWRAARPLETATARIAPGPLPADFVVVATDGSQIEADRHYGLECHLLNFGLVSLRYGTYSAGKLDVTSQILFGEDLYITDPGRPADRQKIEGQLFAARRSILELAEVVRLAEAGPADLPVLALQDGTLTLWNLLGSQHRQFVSRALLEEQFLPELDRARQLQETRPLVLAAYISQSSAAEVLNLIRLNICDKQPRIDCVRHCSGLPQPHPERTCDAVAGVFDRDIFAELLDYGERSAVFEVASNDVKTAYGSHATAFFYLNVGTEIARIEVPGWLARRPERLDLVHRLVLDQVERGLGYPVALIEAHERAIVRTADRDEFSELIERELLAARLRVPASEKYVSKRIRAI